MKKNSGKAPSVQLYYKDLLADMVGHDPEIVGAWMLTLIKIWHEKNHGQITKTIDELAKIMQTTTDKARYFVSYFSQKNIADVTEHNGEITIVNRRTKRDAKLREQNNLRQKRYKGKIANNAEVTAEKHRASSSSSSSSSYYTTTTVAAAGVTKTHIDTIISEWNKVSRKKSNGSEFFSVQREVSGLLEDVNNSITVDVLLQAIGNYGAAIALPNSQAGQFTLCNFLRRGIKNYLPGYFDIDNFDKSKFDNGKKEYTEDEQFSWMEKKNA